MKKFCKIKEKQFYANVKYSKSIFEFVFFLKTSLEYIYTLSADDPYPVDALPYCTHAEDVCNNDKSCKNKV